MLAPVESSFDRLLPSDGSMADAEPAPILVVRFPYGRTTVEEVSIDAGGESPLHLDRVPGTERSFWLRDLEKSRDLIGTADGAVQGLRARFTGDLPGVPEVIWFSAGPEEGGFEVLSLPEGAGGTLAARVARQEAEATRREIQQALCLARADLERATMARGLDGYPESTIRAGRAAWLHFDTATQAAVLKSIVGGTPAGDFGVELPDVSPAELESIAYTVEALSRWVAGRHLDLGARFAKGLCSAYVRAGDELDPALRGKWEQLESFVRTLLVRAERQFVQESGERWTDLYALFAIGAFGTSLDGTDRRLFNFVPDGPNLLAFLGAALIFGSLGGRHQEFWRDRVPEFALMQELFLDRYSADFTHRLERTFLIPARRADATTLPGRQALEGLRQAHSGVFVGLDLLQVGRYKHACNCFRLFCQDIGVSKAAVVHLTGVGGRGD